jgi:formate dehydrogenase major subunit
MESFPHELSGYRHISDTARRQTVKQDWGVVLDPEPGLRIPNMLDAAIEGSFRAIYIQGEDILQSDPDMKHVPAALAALPSPAVECVILHDPLLNEMALRARCLGQHRRSRCESPP